MSTPQQTPAASPAQAETAIRKARGALKRYRFMAILTGCMLLVLCVELIFKYVVPVEVVVDYLGWVPFAHGWIYVVYLVTVFDLWATMRWRFGRLVTMALAGIVPVMSFVLERRVHTQGLARVEAAEAAQPVAG